MKKILTMLIIALAVFLIYLGFKDNDIYYLSLGDSLAYGTTPYGGKDYGYGEYVRDYLKGKDKLEVYVDSSIKPNKRTIDIIKDIQDNVKIEVNGKQKTFQNALIKADFITISIGLNDFIGGLAIGPEFGMQDLYNRFEQAYMDMEQLFRVMREYCKEDIVVIGYFDPTNSENLQEYFKYINQKIQELAASYNMQFINLQNILSDGKYFENKDSFFPNKDGYQVIGEEIVKILEAKTLKK